MNPEPKFEVMRWASFDLIFIGEERRAFRCVQRAIIWIVDEADNSHREFESVMPETSLEADKINDAIRGKIGARPE